MVPGLNRDILYSAHKIDALFQDDLGKTKAISGTGFFLQNAKNQFCLVTNRHVADIDYKQKTRDYVNYKLVKLTAIGKEKNTTTGLPDKEYALDLHLATGMKYSSNYANDVACLVDVRILSPSPILDYWLPAEQVADKAWIDEKLGVCDFVSFPGFPEWFDKKNNLPIMRVGTIASDPRFNYSYDGDDCGDCVAYEAFSFGGSSGSPVFAIPKGIQVGKGVSGGGYREGKIVGINAGHLPVQGTANYHSGISYFYKSSIILDIINQ